MKDPAQLFPSTSKPWPVFISTILETFYCMITVISLVPILFFHTMALHPIFPYCGSRSPVSLVPLT